MGFFFLDKGQLPHWMYRRPSGLPRREETAMEKVATFPDLVELVEMAWGMADVPASPRRTALMTKLVNASKAHLVECTQLADRLDRGYLDLRQHPNEKREDKWLEWLRRYEAIEEVKRVFDEVGVFSAEPVPASRSSRSLAS
jgi:transposase